jgi:hypothetical protein
MRPASDAQALFRRHVMQRAHVVEPVGELDEQDADIVDDGEQELAEILALRRLLRDQVELLDLGQPVHQPADIGPEHALDLLERGGRVLDRVMQHGCHDRGVVELEIGQEGGDFERMGEERVARGTLLRAVRAHGVDIGPVEQVLVGIRIVAANPVDEFVLPHHAHAGPLLRLPNLQSFNIGAGRTGSKA